MLLNPTQNDTIFVISPPTAKLHKLNHIKNEPAIKEVKHLNNSNDLQNTKDDNCIKPRMNVQINQNSVR